MKRKTLNLGLGALALGLIGVVTISEKKAEDALVPKKGEPLTALASDAVTKIALHHPDAPDITLEKKDGYWLLTAPVATAADAAAAGQLAAFGAAETRGQLDLAQIKRADLGLDPPKATLLLNDTAIAFGGIEPLKYTRYVEVGAGSADDRIRLIDNPREELIDADYADLASKALLPENAKIAAIELPGLSVKRKSDGSGWSTLPANADASSDALQSFVDGWRHARSVQNLSSTLAETPAPTKPEPATITLEDGSTLKLLIVGRGRQLVLERPDLKIRYQFANDEATQLLKLPVPKAEDAAPPSEPPAAPPKP